MTKDRDGDHAESACNATTMRKASRRLSQLYDMAIERSGLRATQFAILTALDHRSKEPPTMAELAQALVMDRSALGHNLRPLERDRLIALQESAADRRRRHVVLTAEGRTKLQEARRLWQKAQERFNTVFGEAEAQALRNVLLSIAYDDRLTRLAD